MKIHALQNDAIRLIGKTNVLKHHLACHRFVRAECRGGGAIRHFLMFIHQPEHARHVSERLTNLAINHTEKIERRVKLNQECVDQNQVAHGHLAGDHAVNRAPHYKACARGNKQALTEV